MHRAPLAVAGIMAQCDRRHYHVCVTTKPGDTTYPAPVAWTPERDRRGASPTASAPRCPVKGCIIRYAAGADRLCREHARDDSELDPRDLATGPGADREHRWPVVSQAKQVLSRVVSEAKQPPGR